MQQNLGAGLGGLSLLRAKEIEPYYPGAIDGIIGSQSVRAIKAFQRTPDHAQWQKIIDSTLGDLPQIPKRRIIFYTYTKIKGDLRKKLPQVKDRLSGDKFLIAAYIFGSYSKTEEGALSDIDIALLLDENLATEDRKKCESYVYSQLIDVFEDNRFSLKRLNDKYR